MLLKKQGFNVTGVFIKIWRPEFTECTWREDRLDAMRVAVALSIPFREIDLSLEYKRGVIDEMTNAYARGMTPNPDVHCNSVIKFGSFLAYALAEGADYIATGHYARVRKNKRRHSEGSIYELLRGKDKNKDQSYFLHMLGQHELSRALFPIGDLEKSETRRLAARYGLPVAGKRDSQGLCFVGDITIPEFLSHYILLSVGPVLNTNGEQIGEHGGAALFTIGQRHGFRASESRMHYVVAIDVRKNAITVSDRREDAARTSCMVDDLHFIGEPRPTPFEVTAQTRYRGEKIATVIESAGGIMKVRFQSPLIVSPGQSIVLYQGDACIGGGIIASEQ